MSLKLYRIAIRIQCDLHVIKSGGEEPLNYRWNHDSLWLFNYHHDYYRH